MRLPPVLSLLFSQGVCTLYRERDVRWRDHGRNRGNHHGCQRRCAGRAFVQTVSVVVFGSVAAAAVCGSVDAAAVAAAAAAFGGVAIEDFHVVVEGLYKGNLGGPPVALLVYGCHKVPAHAVLVGIHDAPIREQPLALPNEGAALESTVDGQIVVVVALPSLLLLMLLFVLVLVFVRKVSAPFPVNDRQLPPGLLERGDLRVCEPDVVRFLRRGPLKGCDVDHLVEPNRLLCRALGASRWKPCLVR